MPEKSVDPIVLSSSLIMQLQTIISCELPASERAVVAVGTSHGGTKANVIPDKVGFELNTRCYSQEILVCSCMMIEELRPQYFRHFRHTHRRTWVAGVGFLYGID